METLKSKDADAFEATLPAFFTVNEGRERLVADIKATGAEAAILTDEELATYGIARGAKFTLKGSKTGSIARVRRLDDGRLYVRVR